MVLVLLFCNELTFSSKTFLLDILLSILEFSFTSILSFVSILNLLPDLVFETSGRMTEVVWFFVELAGKGR